MICERCGKEFFEDYRKSKKSPLRFCSVTCANKRVQTTETKEKTKASLKETYDKIESEGRKCENCNSIFHSRDMSRKLCFTCQPKTIKLIKVDNMPKSIFDVSKRTAMKIVERMELPCSCCGFYIKGVHLDFHHIVPRKLNGTDDMTNIAYICPNCHRIAHTDTSLLERELVSVEDQLKSCNKNWLDFYYGHTGE